MSHLTWFGNTVFEIDVCCSPVLSPRELAPQTNLQFLKYETLNVKTPAEDLLAMVLLVMYKGKEGHYAL